MSMMAAGGQMFATYLVLANAETAPEITAVTPSTFADGDSVTVDGSSFGASQGSGKVELGDSSDYATATLVTQTIDSWSDTSIGITIAQGGLSVGTVYVFVTNDDGGRSEGFAVTLEHVSIEPTENAASNVAESIDISEKEFLEATENAASNVTESPSTEQTEFVDATENAAANVTEDPSISTEADVTENAASNVTESQSIAAEPQVTEDAEANVTEAQSIQVTGDFPPLSLRAVVYDSAGVAQGPLMTILGAEYRHELDRIGEFSMTIPADDRRASLVKAGRRIWLYREGEGLVFKGLIGGIETQVDTDGRAVLAISGSSITRELVHRNTLLGREYDGATLGTVVADLLTGTDISSGSLDTPSTNMTARFDGATRWKALERTANTFGLHLREDVLNDEIDVGAFGSDSGIILRNVESISPQSSVIPITGLSIAEEGRNIWNRIIPLGAGEGVNKLDLQYATRTSPYTIQTGTLPNGETYYYLEDSASVSAHGVREKVVSFKDASPLANSGAGFEKMANALYDVAVTWLQRHKDPPSSYDVSCLGLRHVDPLTGAPDFEVGDKLRLVYRGIAEGESKRVWRDLDDLLWLMSYSRSFAEDGSDSWSLTVSDVDRAEEDPVADVISDVQTQEVALKHYTFRDSYILQRVSIDGSNDAELRIEWDANIALVHKVALTFRTRALRSNVSTMANDGDVVDTTGSGGGQTSQSGTSHDHGVSGQAAQSGGGSVESTDQQGDHIHLMFTASSAVSNIRNTSSVSASDLGIIGVDGHTHEALPLGSEFGNSTNDHTNWGVAEDANGNAHNIPAHSHAMPFQVFNANATQGKGDIYLGESAAAGTEYYTEGADGDHKHDVTIPPHEHSVSATISDEEASHTHDVDDHDHSVTIPSHKHALQYGIFVAANPSSPGITISINGTDRTSALGGPWDSVDTDITVDITQYLQGTGEQPLRQVNSIVFGGSELADIEAIARADLTRSALLPA